MKHMNTSNLEEMDIAWNWRATARTIAFSILPLMFWYLTIYYRAGFGVIFALLTTFIYPGPVVFPFLFYRIPVKIRKDGIIIFDMIYHWNEIEEVNIEWLFRDIQKEGVSFSYDDSCKERINQMPFIKRMIFIIALPSGGFFKRKTAVMIPTGIKMKPKELAKIIKENIPENKAATRLTSRSS